MMRADGEVLHAASQAPRQDIRHVFLAMKLHNSIFVIAVLHVGLGVQVHPCISDESACYKKETGNMPPPDNGCKACLMLLL